MPPQMSIKLCKDIYHNKMTCISDAPYNFGFTSLLELFQELSQ